MRTIGDTVFWIIIALVVWGTLDWGGTMVTCLHDGDMRPCHGYISGAYR